MCELSGMDWANAFAGPASLGKEEPGRTKETPGPGRFVVIAPHREGSPR